MGLPWSFRLVVRAQRMMCGLEARHDFEPWCRQKSGIQLKGRGMAHYPPYSEPCANWPSGLISYQKKKKGWAYKFKFLIYEIL